MEPEDLERALRDAAGGLPGDVPEYAPVATAARTRRRRRTAAIGAATAVVLVAGGLAVAAGGRGDTSRIVATPAPSSPPLPTDSPSPVPTPPATSTAPALPPVTHHTASLTEAPTPTPDTCVPALEPYDDPPADDTAAYPDRFWYAASDGLFLTPARGSWPARRVLPSVHKEWDEDHGMGAVARASDGRFFVVYGLPCGTGVFTFTAHGTVTRLATVPVHLWQFYGLMLSPDERSLAVFPFWGHGPGWEPISHVVVLDTTTGAVVHTVDVPNSEPQAWLADGSGFFYVGTDHALHRIHLDGSEGPVTAPPATCEFDSAGRGRGDTLMAGLLCGGAQGKVVRLAEDGTVGADVGQVPPRNGVTDLTVAPDGSAALAGVGAGYPVYLLVPGQPEVKVQPCTGTGDCYGTTPTGFAW